MKFCHIDRTSLRACIFGDVKIWESGKEFGIETSK